ncbi:hypothetical protein J6590_019296 [Homalodisca vitripennis]|nr:hypothetical protein J6590_019296 [Homalodisca vitripennis]
MCHLNLGNLMDVQERHITNRKCRDSEYQRFSLVSTRVCQLLPALTGEAGYELASPSSEGHGFEISVLFFLMDLDRRRLLSPNLLYPSYSGSSAKIARLQESSSLAELVTMNWGIKAFRGMEKTGSLAKITHESLLVGPEAGYGVAFSYNSKPVLHPSGA